MITFWSLMVESANIWSSPEEGNPPSLLQLSRLNKPLLWGYTPTTSLESGLLPPSIGVCKSATYAKKQRYKWVFYRESSIPLQTLHHCCNCTWLTSYTSGVCSTCMELLSTGTYQLPGKSEEVCTAGITKNWSSSFESLLQSWNLSALASRIQCLKLCLFYETVKGQLNLPTAYCTHCTTKLVQISQKHHYTSPWKTSNTHKCQSLVIFFPVYNCPMEQPTSTCTKLPVIVFL